MTHADALRMLAAEGGFVAVLAANLLDGRAITETDFERAALAASKLQRAVEFVEHGQY